VSTTLRLEDFELPASILPTRFHFAAEEMFEYGFAI